MKYTTLKTLVINLISLVVALAASLFSISAHAVNERLCSPGLHGHQVAAKFTKGGFTFAGDGGKRADIVTRYDNDNRAVALYDIFEANGFGGNTGVDYKLCYVDQARAVGAPSTLIFVWGHKDNCGNWWGWAQVQSASVYDTCEFSKSGNTVNITLK